MHASAGSDRVTYTLESLQSGLSLGILRLQKGPLGLCELASLIALADSMPPQTPLLLVTEHATVPKLRPGDEQDWILLAGQYRAWQHQFKQQGGKLASLVTECAIGGSYLVHGMGASIRLAYDHALFYPTLAQEHYEARFKTPYPHPTDAPTALAHQLITHIIPKQTEPSALGELVIFLFDSHHA